MVSLSILVLCFFWKWLYVKMYLKNSVLSINLRADREAGFEKLFLFIFSLFKFYNLSGWLLTLVDVSLIVLSSLRNKIPWNLYQTVELVVTARNFALSVSSPLDFLMMYIIAVIPSRGFVPSLNEFWSRRSLVCWLIRRKARDSMPGQTSNQNMKKIFFLRFPPNRFLAKALRGNKSTMKEFLQKAVVRSRR